MSGDITVTNMFLSQRDESGKVGFVPLGPLYVTSVLEAAGFDVDFRDYLVGSVKYSDPVDYRSILDFLDDPCDVVALGCNGCTLPAVLYALEKLKERYPRKTVILGGIGPTGTARGLLTHFPFIDIVVRGEGERTMVELMQALESGKDLHGIKGIDFRKEGRVYSNPGRERIVDLDKLPFPAYHKSHPDNYTCAGLVSARGCPFPCTFCDVAPFWGRDRYYTRSIGKVVEEIRFLKEEYNQQVVTLFDETFPLDKTRVLEFCRQVKEQRLDVQWTCSARIKPMDEETLREMSRAGCFMVFYGVESGSDNVLRQTKKGYTRRDVEKVIDRSLKYMAVNSFFMWGFPFETMEDFFQTLDFVDHVARLGVTPVVHIVNPLPLSELYRQYKEKLAFSRDLHGDSLLMRHEEIIRMIEKYPGIFTVFYHCDANIREKYRIAETRGMANNLIALDPLGQEYGTYRRQ